MNDVTALSGLTGRLRKMREAAGLSREAMAALLGWPDEASVRNVESGADSLSLQQSESWARACGVEIEVCLRVASDLPLVVEASRAQEAACPFLRERVGKSQREIAKLTGLEHQSVISRLESQSRRIHLDTISEYALACGAYAVVVFVPTSAGDQSLAIARVGLALADAFAESPSAVSYEVAKSEPEGGA